jgi:hypothetical protein
MRINPAMVVICGTVLLSQVVYAQLSSSDLKIAEKLVKGKYYLRLDAPCIYGKNLFCGGDQWIDPLVQVSPTGHKLLPIPSPLEEKFIYWGSGPNDLVGYGTVKTVWSSLNDRANCKGKPLPAGTYYIWLDGVDPTNEIVIAFVNITTLDDFKAAFKRTFSGFRLEEEHPEWPSVIRISITKNRLIEGMTKEQAFCVVGEPAAIETAVDNGVPVEIWHPRQENGLKRPFRDSRPMKSGYPAMLKFVDGKLVTIEQAGTGRK